MRSHGRHVQAFGRDRIPGEFVFVPALAGSGEGEGRLVGLVIDTASHTTDFVVLDARSFEAPPIAKVRLRHRIPPGFPGNWFPARDTAGMAKHGALGDRSDAES